MQAVAEMGFAFAQQYFSISFGIGLMIVPTVLVSWAIGQGRPGEPREIAVSTLVISALLQSFVAVVMIFYRHEFVAMAGAEGKRPR